MDYLNFFIDNLKMTESDLSLSNPLIEVKALSKQFPGVIALSDIDFDINPGEVHVLLGENGAGKSTLIKILCGVYSPDSGKIFFNGHEAVFNSPSSAQQTGISVIYQEPSLVANMTVAENIYLGNEPTHKAILGYIDHQRQTRELMALFDRLNLSLDPDTSVEDLSLSEKQMVAIARAVHLSTHLIIMDEPTTMLHQAEVAQLFSIIRKLRSEGISILYVTHQLEEAMQIGDRATILRDGKCITTMPINETSRSDMISLIIGRSLNDQFVRIHTQYEDEILRLEELSSPSGINHISLSLHKGEIVGITGLLGAGGTAILRAIFGADPITDGCILVDGRPVKINHPQDAIAIGIGMLTEDRQEQGLVLEMRALENISLASLDHFGEGPFINLEIENKVVRHYAQRLNIHSSDLSRQALHLSGGTQQKVILSRWLATQCRILLFDEPTRGIDVGARHEFYQLLNELTRRGVGMVIVSSNLQELVTLADRILVLRQGSIVSEFDYQNFNLGEILSMAGTGGNT